MDLWSFLETWSFPETDSFCGNHFEQALWQSAVGQGP
jgi:hypothetical protein